MLSELDITLLLILIAFGFLAGFIDSVAGGGGLISLPVLLSTGMNPAAAVATNKLVGTMGSFTSSLVFFKSGKLELSTVYKLFPVVFIGSIIGAWTVHLMDPAVLKPLMLIMLALVAFYTLVKKDWGGIYSQKKLTKRNFILFVAAMFAIGCYDGFLGPGTGSFLIFAFLIIGADFIKAAGNAKFLNFGSNIAALLMFIYLGEVNFLYGFPMAIACVGGAVMGARLAISKGSRYIRFIFITITFVLLAKNLYDVLGF
ncbi:TSUP family transporter [Gracilibacillus salinarum]|uniref:Probable membrane transporter protein n=1 Tax=Gracilibacillus salinarum TaxID=2932255 RepID=A0ABY4GUC7_9BACI|nr:TSUP family transporter [Gracilibacillus salinarum]UOQ87560.1 TSUP family transporter [Gracilibacillus salinarum]